MAAATIMTAEGSPAIRSLIRGLLTAQGYTVAEADTGSHALQQADRVQPDVILLDCDLRTPAGASVLEALRDREATRHTPVIFLTSGATVADVADGLARGAHDYLRKPVDPAELVARVSAALRVGRLDTELRQRNAELDVVARTDVLTGLFNRRHLEESLRRLSSQARRYSQPLSVVMFDIDNFRAINEEFGEAAGDDVLRTIARRVQASVRDSDIIGRWGGEEFLTLLPMTDVDGARTFGERIRAMIDWAEVVIDGVGTVHVTVSAGCAEGADVGNLLLACDAALYAAKKSGRNAVRTA
jgi:diguanylate cyclase (GGDEF)-like protein